MYGRTVGIMTIATIAFWLLYAVVVLIGSLVGVLGATGQAVQASPSARLPSRTLTP